MAIGQIRQIISDETSVVQMQQSLNDQFNQIAKIPFINGSQLTAIALVTGSLNSINHKLGRKAQGYFLTSNSANAVVWNDAFNDTTLDLRCSANTTVNIWVF